MKLSFKKRPKETGLRAVGSPHPFVDIKGDGKIVGWVQPKSWRQDYFKVWLHVKQGDSFENKCLSFNGETEECAREFIKKNWNTIQEKYPLYQLED